MTTFVDEEFPEAVAKGSRGGPRMSMSVSELDSGVQERARRWPTFRWEYEISLGLKNLPQHDQAYKHYLAVGPDQSFPFKDLQDFTSAADGTSAPTTSGTLDQVIGIGTGTTGSDGVAVFPLIKTYSLGGRSYVRTIRKPRTGTVTVSVAGTVKTLGTHYTLNLSTGEVSFTATNVPTSGQIVRASFEFRVPVMYGAEFVYRTSIDEVMAGRVSEMMLVEDVTQGTITPEFMFMGDGSTVTFGVDTPYDYAWGSSVVFVPTATPLSIILPDINELPFGGPYFVFYNNASAKTINFKNKATAATEFSLTFGVGAHLLVQRDPGDVRKWIPY